MKKLVLVVVAMTFSFSAFAKLTWSYRGNGVGQCSYDLEGGGRQGVNGHVTEADCLKMCEQNGTNCTSTLSWKADPGVKRTKDVISKPSTNQPIGVKANSFNSLQRSN